MNKSKHDEDSRNSIKRSFETDWTKHVNEKALAYDKRHSSKLMKWLLRPEWLKKSTSEYRLVKFTAEFFFLRGIIFHQKEMLK